MFQPPSLPLAVFHSGDLSFEAFSSVVLSPFRTFFTRLVPGSLTPVEHSLPRGLHPINILPTLTSTVWLQVTAYFRALLSPLVLTPRLPRPCFPLSQVFKIHGLSSDAWTLLGFQHHEADHRGLSTPETGPQGLATHGTSPPPGPIPLGMHQCILPQICSKLDFPPLGLCHLGLFIACLLPGT